MLKTLLNRLKQGYRTVPFPEGPVNLPERFRGLPTIDQSCCPADCRKCVDGCPTGAVRMEDQKLGLDLGRCLFCADCRETCPQGAIRYTQDHRLAVFKREDLIMRGNALVRSGKLDGKIKQLFGRSLKLRQVSAGGCNGCELDTNVLNTVVFDLGRFGIQFVASPRHADGILVTGPVTENMRLALQKTYDAVPTPKLVIAVGACAISGGPYIDHPQVHNGVSTLLPVDLFVPGCPPHPLTILDGLLRLLGRIK
jgi:Ni,Fe-hydrogenase III small subunit/formate hydrogenlyase subunit 6/NADH:ubiquinone oxidoreductase subunit I